MRSVSVASRDVRTADSRWSLAVAPESRTSANVPMRHLEGADAAGAEAILRLYQEPALRTKLGNAGCAAARAGYSTEAVIGQVEALYSKLASRRVA